MECLAGIEPVSEPWQGSVLAIVRPRQMVRIAGLEPAWDLSQRILSPPCIPISPYPQMMQIISLSAYGGFTPLPFDNVAL